MHGTQLLNIIKLTTRNTFSKVWASALLYFEFCYIDRWTRHLATPDMDEQNNCTESSYFLNCKMTMRNVQFEHRDRRCLLNMDVVDSCDMEVRHRNNDRVATLDAIYCKIYSLLVEFAGVIYKNPHCAACNGVKINNTFCLESISKGN